MKKLLIALIGLSMSACSVFNSKSNSEIVLYDAMHSYYQAQTVALEYKTHCYNKIPRDNNCENNVREIAMVNEEVADVIGSADSDQIKINAINKFLIYIGNVGVEYVSRID